MTDVAWLSYETERGRIAMPVHDDVCATHRFLQQTIDVSTLPADGYWYCTPGSPT